MIFSEHLIVPSERCTVYNLANIAQRHCLQMLAPDICAVQKSAAAKFIHVFILRRSKFNFQQNIYNGKNRAAVQRKEFSPGGSRRIHKPYFIWRNKIANFVEEEMKMKPPAMFGKGSQSVCCQQLFN